MGQNQTQETLGQINQAPQADAQYNTQNTQQPQVEMQYTAQPQQVAAQDFYNAQYDGQTQYANYTGTVTSPVIEESKKGRGVLGALLGALVGGIAWTAIGCLGYISGWIAILIFFLAQFGYRKLAGKLDKFGVVISLIFGLLMIVPATYVAYAFSICNQLNEAFDGGFTYMEIIFNLPQYMDRYELWGEFAGNLGLGYVFTGVAAFFMGASALGDKVKKKAKNKKDAQNLK